MRYRLRKPRESKTVHETPATYPADLVGYILGRRERAVRDLERENAILRDAILGLRRFARLDRMTPEQIQGYDLASKDALLQASQVINIDWDDLPPLGCGSAE